MNRLLNTKNKILSPYLGLQNQYLGNQARPDYQYHSYRRAKHRIIVGDSVTPKTNVGDYIVEANGKLTLKAGGEIILKPGTYFMPGSVVHIVPEYQACNISKMQSADAPVAENNAAKSPIIVSPNSEEADYQQFKIYPNPVKEELTIENLQRNNIERVIFYDIDGKIHLDKTENKEKVKIKTNNLEKGIYILKIFSNGTPYTQKIIVL